MSHLINTLCSKALSVNSDKKINYEFDISSDDAIGTVSILDSLVQSLIKLSYTVVPESKKYEAIGNTLRSDLTIFLNKQLRDLRISVIKCIKQKQTLLSGANSTVDISESDSTGNTDLHAKVVILNNKMQNYAARIQTLEDKISKLEQGYTL